MTRPVYKSRLRPDGVVVVEDLSDGTMTTVTNGAEQVVEDLLRQGLDLRRLVYRDTSNQYDGIAVKDGRFRTFVLLGQDQEDLAARDALAMDDAAWMAGG